MDHHHHYLLHVRAKKCPVWIHADSISSSILTGLPAGAYGSGNDQMSAEFNVDNSGFPWLNWATTSWNMGAALFPLVFVPLTENTGRMPGYFVCAFCLETPKQPLTPLLDLIHHVPDLALPFRFRAELCNTDCNPFLRRWRLERQHQHRRWHNHRYLEGSP